MTKIFFFKNSQTGEIFAAENKEASIQRRFHQLLGASDGVKYERIVNEGRDELHEISNEIDELQKDLESIDAEDVEARMAIRRELRSKQREYRDRMQPYLEKAFNAELEVARNNFEQPVPENRKEMTGEGDKLNISVTNG